MERAWTLAIGKLGLEFWCSHLAAWSFNVFEPQLPCLHVELVTTPFCKDQME